jgi:hypothetical protein
MTRTAVRRLTASLAAGLIACSLLLAAVALAAAPKKNARFSGHTSAPPVAGFRAPVSFKVAADGRSLTGFSFGSFGCFGAGGFRPNVNPYTGGAILRPAGRVKVTAKGRISLTGGKSTASAGGLKTVTTVAIVGRFSAAKRVSGTITFSQKITGAFEGKPVNQGCGPGTIQFSASTR